MSVLIKCGDSDHFFSINCLSVLINKFLTMKFAVFVLAAVVSTILEKDAVDASQL